MAADDDLARFVEAQEGTYATARAEIAAGAKASHWMWFVYPQLRGLGRSETARFYGIAGRDEAAAYLAHPVLGPRLVEMSELLLRHRDRAPEAIFGGIDALKLRSSMTLFAALPDAPPVFANVLDAFFAGARCPRTEAALA
ncbi:hypothetical protein OG2516_10646 [Oceanicola granulosus HTCC2516]|uniref:Calpastatin n=1 Tax=Oceanicola granulosus (strain ATCC BAA-861 / DSM 15982 / KCTC 12143 / HTCC2516) TaxID=314256 RepID=Q2CK74_OCEGH|nr:DUF1810 domain-containing protein [Oceanicola granulosus]EAR52915.1 hypothetical protein OG2516_10646 [Oceanicola granulosus HTCC2516]